MRNEELLLISGPTPVIDEIYDILVRETRGTLTHVLKLIGKTLNEFGHYANIDEGIEVFKGELLINIK